MVDAIQDAMTEDGDGLPHGFARTNDLVEGESFGSLMAGRTESVPTGVLAFVPVIVECTRLGGFRRLRRPAP